MDGERMTITDDTIIDDVLDREKGEYTNRAGDRGGPTRWGVTQDTLAGWRAHPVSPEDVQLLTRDEAQAIYRAQYINAPGFSKIGDGALRGLLVDCGVLSGPKNAVRMLQRALGVVDDGVFGPATEAALRLRSSKRLFVEVMAQRVSFLGRLVSKDLTDADRDGIPDAAENDWGWMNRVADMLRDFAEGVL